MFERKYPTIVEGASTTECEVYEINFDDLQRMNDMERRAGYKLGLIFGYINKIFSPIFYFYMSVADKILLTGQGITFTPINVFNKDILQEYLETLSNK